MSNEGEPSGYGSPEYVDPEVRCAVPCRAVHAVPCCATLHSTTLCTSTACLLELARCRPLLAVLNADADISAHIISGVPHTVVPQAVSWCAGVCVHHSPQGFLDLDG